MADTVLQDMVVETAEVQEAAPVTETRPMAQPKEPVNGYWWGTGRRKSAVARVRIRKGEGKITINGREVDDFFTQVKHRESVRAPLAACDALGSIDVFVNVNGGGITGQAGAVVLGIARALKGMDPTLDTALRDGHYLTRDPRMVERKKYGRRGARRSFQFSKR